MSIDELSQRIGALEEAVQRLEEKLDQVDVAKIAAELQHAVIIAISQHEGSLGTPATTGDVQQVGQRIDELRTTLLG